MSDNHHNDISRYMQEEILNEIGSLKNEMRIVTKLISGLTSITSSTLKLILNEMELRNPDDIETIQLLRNNLSSLDCTVNAINTKNISQNINVNLAIALLKGHKDCYIVVNPSAIKGCVVVSEEEGYVAIGKYADEKIIPLDEEEQMKCLLNRVGVRTF